MDIDKIKELMELIEGTDVSRLTVETEALSVEIERNAGGVPTAHASVPMMPAMTAAAPMMAAAAPAPAAPTPEPENNNWVKVTSPFVGTFYRAASPDAKPYTEVGAVVKKGDSLCIVEAMKLMNEIEAEINGTVRKILVTNEDPVEFGQHLFEIEPSE